MFRWQLHVRIKALINKRNSLLRKAGSAPRTCNRFTTSSQATSHFATRPSKRGIDDGGLCESHWASLHRHNRPTATLLDPHQRLRREYGARSVAVDLAIPEVRVELRVELDRLWHSANDRTSAPTQPRPSNDVSVNRLVLTINLDRRIKWLSIKIALALKLTARNNDSD